MYKVLLHPKLDNNSASRIVSARKNVPESGGGERRWDDDDVPMSEQNADNDGEPIDRFHFTDMITSPPNPKKCLAVLHERKGMSTIRLKYAFFRTETEQFCVSGDEHCKPTVGHITQTLLHKHLAMSMVQLTEKFDLQLQLLDIEFAPAEFINIDPCEWCAKLVKDRGKYKVQLHSKLDNNSASRIVGARKNVPESVGGERRWDDGYVPMGGQQIANRAAGRRCGDEDVPMRGHQNANKAAGRRCGDEDVPMRGQQNANRAAGRRCGDEDVPMRGQQNANKAAGRRCHDGGVPMSEQQNAYNDWEQIDRFHVPGKGHLGNLNNVLSDNFVTSNDLGFMRKKFNMRSPTEQRAMKPYNDIMEEYILLVIQDAERLVVESDREADRKLQMENLKGHYELLSLYNEQKKLTDTANAGNSIGPKVIKAEDVTECFEKLCKLPIFGPIIKQMHEVQQKTRKDNAKEYKEQEAGTGFMPKPSRHGMPANRVEQYLNELEQQSLLNLCANKQRKNELLMEQQRIEQQKKWQQQLQDYAQSHSSNANSRQCKGKPSVKSGEKLHGMSRYGAHISHMASGSAGFRQQPESTSKRIPVFDSAYSFVRPSPAQPLQQQPQQQWFESFSSDSSSTSHYYSNNRYNRRAPPSNGNQNQSSRFGQRPIERQ